MRMAKLMNLVQATTEGRSGITPFGDRASSGQVQLSPDLRTGHCKRKVQSREHKR